MLPRTHPRELLLPEQVAVAGPTVDVQRHHVRTPRAAHQSPAAAGVASASLSAGVVEQHRHAERLGLS
jgi:hypothetical protein